MLPAVTISCTVDGYRNLNNVDCVNPIFVLDIDAKENTHVTDWNKAKIELFKLPYVFFVSYSCSGKGIYALIYFNTQLNIKNMYASLIDDVKEKTDLL